MLLKAIGYAGIMDIDYRSTSAMAEQIRDLTAHRANF